MFSRITSSLGYCLSKKCFHKNTAKLWINTPEDFFVNYTAKRIFNKCWHDASLFNKFDESFKKDPLFVLGMLECNPKIIQFVDKSIKSDKLFLSEALKVNKIFLKHLGLDDKEFIYSIIKENKEYPNLNLFEYIAIELKTDREFMEGLVKLGYNSDEISFEYLKAMVKEKPDFFKQANDSIKSNESQIIELLKINEKVIKYVNTDLFKNSNFIREAVQANWGVLKHINQTEELMYFAIKQNRNVFGYLSLDLAKNLKFMESLADLGFDLKYLRTRHKYAVEEGLRPGSYMTGEDIAKILREAKEAEKYSAY